MKPGPGVDDQQRADALWMRASEGKRHVAAEREPANDGALRADHIEDRGDVADGECFAVSGGIVGIVGLAVTAHVPQDQLVIPGKCLDLPMPHCRSR
ncbi:hypothetical protein ACVWZK_000788 [Bradyrhizobium sp. GM0.4]